MIINIDTDYIVSLYNCDFDTAATVLAILNDNEDNLLDKVDDAIIHIVGDNSCWNIRVKVSETDHHEIETKLEIVENHDA